jgi:D-alanyl-D-alanine carboxypeptidase
VLDGAVEEGTLTGVTASVIVGDSGSWSGAAGVDRELNPMSADAPLPTASVGKTIIAAQVLRLAEQGKLGLDDPAEDHLPSELESFDMNGATVRHLLGMRSGIPDPDLPVTEPLPTKIEYFQTFTDVRYEPAGWSNAYSNTDFVLLEVILEEIAHRPIEEVLRDGVLSGPGLGPLRQTASGSIAFDAVRESDSASLARWGYELYGGFLLSDASLRQMTDFYDGYGLGAVDFSPLPGLDEATMETLPWCCYDVPAIGHAGAGATDALALVAFPQTDVVVVVQAQYAGLGEVHAAVRALADAAQP